MGDLRPGKGAHLILNMKYLEHISNVMDDVADVYTDELHDADPRAIINLLAERGWEFEEDNFGAKVYKEIDYKTGSLRLTVVLTKQNELKFDIREWYDPNSARQ